jgi:gliding-associated putative ABC transporter substrate-binding component GldG
MKAKKTYKQTSIFRIAIIGAILIILNFISIRVFTRIDLTTDGIYTLSDASRKLVENLDDKVTVKVYFTEDLPAPYNNNRRVLLDILNDYRSYSDGNLNFEFISPNNEEMEKEAQTNGIPPVEVQVIQEDKVEVKRAYMGMVMLYESRKEAIPLINDLSGLEYDLSTTLKRLTQSEKKTIAFSTSQESNPIQSMRLAADFLSKQYDLMPFDISQGNEIPKEYAALLIVNPEEEFSDSAKAAIDNYLMNGGKIAIFAGSYKIDQSFQTHIGELIETNLDDMLAHYGLGINNDLVRDAQCATIIVTRQESQFRIQNQVQYPYLIRVTNFNPDNIITKQMTNIILQFSSSIDTSLAASRGLQTSVIATSSEATARQNDGVLLDPFYQYSENDFPDEFVPLAAVFSGQFNSFFYGKNPSSQIPKSPHTSIVLVGSGLFMQDIIVQNASDNLTFFANIIDYLTDDVGLISIRSKSVSLPPLDQISDETRNLYKYGNMIIPPVLVILYGIFRWRRRLSVKKAFESQL